MAKFCGNCGKLIEVGSDSCKECGWGLSNLTISAEEDFENAGKIPVQEKAVAVPLQEKVHTEKEVVRESSLMDSNDTGHYDTIGPGGSKHIGKHDIKNTNSSSQTETNSFRQFSKQMSDDSYNKGNKRAGIGLWIAILLIIVAIAGTIGLIILKG